MVTRRRFPHGPIVGKLIFVEAACWLTVVSIAVRVVPFRRLATHLGAHMHESPLETDETQRARARRVGRAIRQVGRRLPFEPGCLAAGVVAMAMLKVRRQSSTLYFGLAKNDEDELDAHAWLRTGDVIVTGGAECDGYVEVSRFMMSGTVEERLS